jgi:putative phosphoesterase
MRIGVVSDTHGNSYAIKKAVQAVGQVNMWLHAGDYNRDIRYLKQFTDVQIISVLGNCDWNKEAKPEEFIEIGGKKIWLTHGHQQKVKYENNDLARRGRQYEVDAVIYGHTHIADITWQDELLLFNPGSTSLPREGFASCGLLIIKDGKITAQILEL